MKRCDHCSEWFEPKYEGVKLCFGCFKKRERALAEYDGLHEEIAWLRQELRKAESAKNQAENAAFSEAIQNLKLLPFYVESARLKTLIQLCHPDKHGGSQTANETTAWLLSLRKNQAA